MTTYIVKCSDVSWQRHSVSVYIGDFQTKLQRLGDQWNIHGAAIGDDDVLGMEGTGDGPGSAGIWITDDYEHDRIPIWRPPYDVLIKRVALIVSCNIEADTDEYYIFSLLNATDDTVIASLSTAATALTAWTPSELTVDTSHDDLTLTDCVLLKILDECGKNPIRGLTIVMDYEPNA